MAEKVGREKPDDRDYCVSFFGIVPPDPKDPPAIRKKKKEDPRRFHYGEDYKWFKSESDAADFVNDKNRLTDYLYKKTKLMRVMTEYWNNDLEFYQIVGVNVKKSNGKGEWMILLKHEKEIVVKFPKKHRTQKIVLPEEENKKDELSASVIKTSYSAE